MRYISLLSSLALLAACESEQLVASEMEQALFDAQAAVAGQLLASEILSHTLDEPTTGATTNTYRHGGENCCPCIERIGEGVPSILTLDYGDIGCVPESNLIPSSLAGHAILEYDGNGAEVTFDDLEVGRDHLITGALEGTLSEDGSKIALIATLEAGSHQVEIEATSLIGDVVRLDGSAVVSGGGSLVLRGLELPWERIGPPCPVPESGHAVLTATAEVDVDFAEPGAGFVTVSRKGRVSESVDWCRYRTDLF